VIFAWSRLGACAAQCRVLSTNNNSDLPIDYIKRCMILAILKKNVTDENLRVAAAAASEATMARRLRSVYQPNP